MRSPLSCLLLASFAPTQVPDGHALVAAAMPGNPATVLVAVDVHGGAVITPLSRFPSDHLAPLSVLVDPVNLDALVAVRDTAAASRILRLALSGTQVIGELQLATFAGDVTDMAVLASGDLAVLVRGTGAGLYRVPRRGGVPVFVLPFTNPTALLELAPLNDYLQVVESGLPGAPAFDPRMHMVDASTGQLFSTHVYQGFAPLSFTGGIEYPTAVPRTAFVHGDGTVSISIIYGNPTSLPLNPPLPPGGAVEAAMDNNFGMLILGGQSNPWFVSVNPLSATPTVQQVAGPLPGDPVDFSIAPGPGARALTFGAGCGPPGSSPRIWTAHSPFLGNAGFNLSLLNGLPTTLALFGLGFREDQAFGQSLPAPLPNGCLLLVDPPAVSWLVTDGFGQSIVSLPIPNLPALSGVTAYCQWFQPAPAAFATSNGAALHLR